MEEELTSPSSSAILWEFNVVVEELVSVSSVSVFDLRFPRLLEEDRIEEDRIEEEHSSSFVASLLLTPH